MDNGSGPGEVWARLIREIIASWRSVLRAVVLVLACTPCAIAVALVFLTSR